MLLRYGANTELRDEEGKLAVEKARERNSEGHKEVVAILHMPRTLDSHFGTREQHSDSDSGSCAGAGSGS